MIPVCAGVLIRSGKILIARRAPGFRRAGAPRGPLGPRGTRREENDRAGEWEFPGGLIEPGETPQAALARELREELGVAAQVGGELIRVRHACDFGEIELIAFLVPRFAGEIRLSEHDRFAWVQARRLLEYELSPADVPVAKALAGHRRRARYKGTHPRGFGEKYKELAGEAEALAKASARGSTPAGAHRPVMLDAALAALEPLDGATVLDCTLGWGGHAEALCRRAGPAGRVVALDRDGEELARARLRLRGLGLALEARQADYADAGPVLAGLGIAGVDGLLADLGVSSMQLDRPERGLSFRADGPLDMRMDRARGETAAAWLARASAAELAEVLRRFGDEPDADRVAAELAALAARGKPPRTTAELAAAVARAKGLPPGRARKKDAFAPHPAARVFQALRIRINAEHESLARLLAALSALVRPGGRAALITFHSGEERLVREALESQARAGLWRAPIAEPQRPAPEETRANPRARSARLWRAVRAGMP